jgi:hypothetical protein
MRSRCVLIVSLLVILATISVASADNHSIFVGPHEVGFNASIPESITIYGPITELGHIGSPGEHYTDCQTRLSRSYDPSQTFLTVDVRNFENSIPINARIAEYDTLQLFYMEMELYNFTCKSDPDRANLSDYTNISGYLVPSVADISPNYRGQYIGVIMMWPSDRIEILILGTLPNLQSWLDIITSLEFDGRWLDESKNLEQRNRLHS